MRLMIASVLLASACAAAQDMSGEYRANMPEMASGLLLRKDSTFEYFLTYGAADYTAKGTWRAEAGAVILDTGGKEQPPFRLVKTAPGDKSEMRVHIQAPNGRGVQHIDVMMETASDKLEARTDQEGVASLPRDGKAKRMFIHVPVYSIEAGPFDVVEGAGEYWFEINGDAITQVRFKSEKLKVAGNGLEMTYWKGEKPLVYRKR